MRYRTISAIVCASTIAAAAGTAGASFTATITADNHYALYVDGPSGVTLVGGNELGAAGSPGTYNWSLPETFTFNTNGYIYIAVWSDDAVAQGLIADIRDPMGIALHTGVAPWQVMMTNSSKGDGSAWPEASEIAMYSAMADADSLWQEPFVGPKNLTSTAPWGKIPGIHEDARWTWGNPNNLSNPLIGGADHSEYQVFRLSVPSPATAGLAIAGLLVMCCRRR